MTRTAAVVEAARAHRRAFDRYYRTESNRHGDQLQDAEVALRSAVRRLEASEAPAKSEKRRRPR